MPDAFIGIDIIVGFPGETKDDFNNNLTYLNNLNINAIHVFSYSERPGTFSEKLPGKVKNSIITERSKNLLQLSEQKLREFYRINIGTKRQVLFESKINKTKMSGFTENYIRVETDYNREWINQIISLNLDSINENGNFEITISPQN